MSSASGETRTEQLALPTLLALFLVPGALVTVAFGLLVPFVERVGFPPIAGLLLAILIVLVPVELGVILRASRPGLAFSSTIPYRRALPLRDWLWLVPVLILAAFVGFGLSMAIEPTVIATFFAWLPNSFVHPIDLDRAGDYSREAWLATLVAYLALNGFVGPIVEELYFRGYLLPRMEWMGHWARYTGQRQSLLAVPLLVAVAGAREDLGLRSYRLRCALEGERVPRHGRPLFPEHARHHPGHRHGARTAVARTRTLAIRAARVPVTRPYPVAGQRRRSALAVTRLMTNGNVPRLVTPHIRASHLMRRVLAGGGGRPVPRMRLLKTPRPVL